MTTNTKAKLYYTGGADPKGDHGSRDLPVSKIRELKDPKGYVASNDLIAAVNVAITLGRPLLVTGEAGTGKSDLAKSVAYDLGLGEPLEFVTKSDTESRDLFYTFDTVGRFHAAQTQGAADDPRRFITYNALGEAILLANGNETAAEFRRPGATHDGPRRSVVLIDEVDKAPRDVPNDILAEIDNLQFEVPELSVRFGRARTIMAADEYRPIVIITSNLEKALPDAFLRRCVYYHVPFPMRDTLAVIVGRRIGQRYRCESTFLDQALSLFEFLREPHLCLRKRPATAELLDWLYVLCESAGGSPPGVLTEHPRFNESLRVTLLKNQADQERDRDLISQWREQSGQPG